MNPIEDQVALINKLYGLVYGSAEEGFDTARCLFKYYSSRDDSSYSVGAQFSYEINGECKSCALPYPESEILNTVIPELHGLMKAHTGGDWQTFTLRINKDGSITTNFEYAEKPVHE